MHVVATRNASNCLNEKTNLMLTLKTYNKVLSPLNMEGTKHETGYIGSV